MAHNRESNVYYKKELLNFSYYYKGSKSNNNLDLQNKLNRKKGKWDKMTRPFPSVCSFLLDRTGGEESGKSSQVMLKNGHTTPIGSARPSSPVHVEEETGKTASLRNPVPEEDPKKRLGKERWIFAFKSHRSIILVSCRGLQEPEKK